MCEVNVIFDYPLVQMQVSACATPLMCQGGPFIQSSAVPHMHCNCFSNLRPRSQFSPSYFLLKIGLKCDTMDCTTLAKALPGLVFMPGSPEYIESTGTYFAAFENELKPLCVVQPTNEQEVAEAVKHIVGIPDVQMAIRGGGHTPWAGAANIDKGITLDLRKLTGVTLNADKAIASISAGERWSNVYTTLEAHGLAVAGGRVSKVGVSGLILGGKLNRRRQLHTLY